MISENCINKNSFYDVETKYEPSHARKGETNEYWRNFSYRIPSNPFVREYLADVYGWVCPVCGKEIPCQQSGTSKGPWLTNEEYERREREGCVIDPRKALRLHHLDYDHSCWTDEHDRFHHEHKGRPNHDDITPPCERCFYEYPDRFAECMSRLLPVHQECNAEVREEYNRRGQI